MADLAEPPRLSIGLPVHNGERFLGEALDSILSQDFEDLEVLVVDNASEDGTEGIVRSRMERDPRVRYLRQERNVGAAGNYNRAFHETRGELFKWCAHDDVCAPGYFSRCIAALDAAGERAAGAFPLMRHIDAAGENLGDVDEDPPWGAPDPAGRLAQLLGDPARTWLHSCVPVMGVLRRRALQGTGLIGSFPSSDKVLICELALRGDLLPVREFLFWRRLHEGISLRANDSDAEVAAWFDPRRGGRFPLPRTSVFRALWTAVGRAPLSRAERRACRRVLLAHLRRREWRAIGGELKIAFRERVLGRPHVPARRTGPPRA